MKQEILIWNVEMEISLHVRLLALIEGGYIINSVVIEKREREKAIRAIIICNKNEKK